MWKPLLTAFFLVFLAELGDKTQLSTMMLASKSNSIWLVFVGSSCALVLSSLCGVLLGSVINKFIPELYIQIGSGVAFLIVGFLLLSGKF
jgi:putative Ca2+/H+ antiporter (TMEM165/GDT1 family)